MSSLLDDFKKKRQDLKDFNLTLSAIAENVDCALEELEKMGEDIRREVSGLKAEIRLLQKKLTEEYK